MRFHRARDVERALRRREQPADHVHVDPGREPRDDLGVPDQVGLRAGDLRKPQEADRAPRGGESLLPNRALERAGHLEDPGASGGVVVGAGRLVAEVRRQHDLTRGRIGPRNRRHDDVVGGRNHLRLDARAQDDLLARGQARPVRLRLALGDHEGEPVGGLIGGQVTPAHEVRIVARPRGRLVGEVRQEPRGPAPFAARLVDGGRVAVGEHDATTHVLSDVVLRRRSPAPTSTSSAVTSAS